MLHHPDNDHWHEWREAVKRTGYNMALANASLALQELESFTPAAFESFTANLYRDVVSTLGRGKKQWQRITLHTRLRLGCFQPYGIH